MIQDLPDEMLLGVKYNNRVPHADQKRQRREVEQILSRLRQQPGVILADEVGMGKTFVALAVSYCVAFLQSRRGPVIIMVPPNLIDKWIQDLKTFCELYLNDRACISREDLAEGQLENAIIRFGTARHSVELMKQLDDPPSVRPHIIFMAQGAMERRQSDKWVRLALIREAIRRHGRGRAERLILVKKYIHRFMGELLQAIGEENACDWGNELWQKLLQTDPVSWKAIYNGMMKTRRRQLDDDPVPESVLNALQRTELREVAKALEKMPVRASRISDRSHLRIQEVRRVMAEVERNLWKQLLSRAEWQSPLLVMDEAHHLKNPSTRLARQFQSPEESDRKLRTGDGAMAQSFDRMLFLTATPFQLGHQELVRVLERFGDVKWDEKQLGHREGFDEKLEELSIALTESQRSAIALQRCWSGLSLEDGPGDADESDQWWQNLLQESQENLRPRQRALVESYRKACDCRHIAEEKLRPWIIRHNKGEFWLGTNILRRQRFSGAAINGNGNGRNGLEVPPGQILPFFLAARSAVTPGKDLLGDALCSSFEAFRYTRKNRETDRDEEIEVTDSEDFSHAVWYLSEFDLALSACSGSAHPKISATVEKAVDLWEKGEKVLIFAFYRQTCGALRIHISQKIEQRICTLARRRFAGAGSQIEVSGVDPLLAQIQNRYFDNKNSRGRKALDRALQAIILRRRKDFAQADVSENEQERLIEVMRRFLRVSTTLVRFFPIFNYENNAPHSVVRSLLDSEDASGISWRKKFEMFIDFLVNRCSSAERFNYLEAAARMQTGGIRVSSEALDDAVEGKKPHLTLANIQVATGTTNRDTRSRLMRAFNTPFFPDILVCSQVMGEGIDLQRYCRNVIHHDLAWNPSSIEQRTGRIDRLGCKGESELPIQIFLPYLSGTADERQYRVMTDREQWFRIVMGQDEVAKLIPEDGERDHIPLPRAFSRDLTFNLGIEDR